MKKIILVILTLILCAASASAKSDVSVSEDTVTINVELSEKKKSQTVSLQVYDENGQLNFADIIYSDKDGKAASEYKNNGATGVYSWQVFAENETERGTFKFYDRTYRDKMLSDFNDMFKNSGSLSEYMKEYGEALGIDGAMDILKSDESGKKPTLDSMALKNTAAAENTEQIKKYIRGVTFAAVAEETKSADGMKKLLSLKIFSDYMNFAMYNTKPLISELNADIQNAFYSKLAQSSVVKEDEIIELMKNSLLTSAAEHAAIASELSKALGVYSENGWINLSSRVNKDGATASLVGEKFADIGAIEKKYNSYKTSSGTTGGGGGGGGSSSGGKKSTGSSGGQVAFTPSEGKTDTGSQKQLFSDVELAMWAAEPIRKAVEAGILTGVGDGKFNPSGELTRAQAAVILCRLAGIEPGEVIDGYSDIRSSDWYAGYASAAIRAEIFFGMSETEFGANLSLNREQAAAVFWRYLNGRGISAKEYKAAFEDDSQISGWAKEAVYSLGSLGIISGKTDSMFCPDRPLLRSEAAVIITKILELKEDGVND